MGPVTKEAGSESESTRRDVIKAALAAVPLAGFDWDAWPAAKAGRRNADEFDAVIIGSGLGGYYPKG